MCCSAAEGAETVSDKAGVRCLGLRLTQSQSWECGSRWPASMSWQPLPCAQPGWGASWGSKAGWGEYTRRCGGRVKVAGNDSKKGRPTSSVGALVRQGVRGAKGGESRGQKRGTLKVLLKNARGDTGFADDWVISLDDLAWAEAKECAAGLLGADEMGGCDAAKTSTRSMAI